MDMSCELFSPEDIRALEKKKKSWTAALWVIALAAVSACVTLCLLTRTANASAMETRVVILSAVSGWVCLYIRRFAVIEAGHELAHARMLAAGERTVMTGTLKEMGARLRIRNSVAIRTCMLDTGEKVVRLKVIDSGAERLAALLGKQVEAAAVNGYIAAVRVL